MAPRKKKTKGKVKNAHNAKPSSKVQVEEILEEPPINVEDKQAAGGNTRMSHKKFGKFRCLLETSNNDDAGVEGEEEITAPTIFDLNEEIQEQSTEKTYLTSSESIEHKTQLKEDQSCNMELYCNSPLLSEEIMGGVKTDEENSLVAGEISSHFANLNFNSNEKSSSIENVMEVSAEEEKPCETAALNLNALECVPEEIIPVCEEQEVEITTAIVDSLDLAASPDEIDDLEHLPKNTETELTDKKPIRTKGKNHKNATQLTRQKNTRKQSPATNIKSRKAGKKVVQEKNVDNDALGGLESSLRRSSRIKSITVSKLRSKGLVKPKTDLKGKKLRKNFNDSDNSENSNSGHTDSEKALSDSPNFLTPTSGYDTDHKPVKVKSRWRRSSELEMVASISVGKADAQDSVEPALNDDELIKNVLKQFVHLKENQYLTNHKINCKEAKKMTCDCFLTPEETDRGELCCGEDCLNRLLYIECGPYCQVNDRCTNKRFQKSQYSPCEVFRTEKKGLGIRATADIPHGQFILEYVGEVIGPDEFDERAAEYSKGKNSHYYFMSLRADLVIDATQKGNISRFINHSCEPNAETQKWTVNGDLRIGFFSTRTIALGEEITFDYHFQRYGKEAQKCFCEAPTCRGWLGEEPDDEEDEEEEEEEAENKVEKIVDADIIIPQPIQAVEQLQHATPTETELPIEGKPDVVTQIITGTPKLPETEIKKPNLKNDKRKSKVRKELFEDVDVDEEIGMLITTGLKNQAHTLKLSRLMVRANEASQRTALLRILRHGELPCRRLFLDYHGLRLVHGWMNDAQHTCQTDKKHESLRLELLQTLATLPIPNKTMLQDSKVLATVETWSTKLEDTSACLDSESNSPQIETETDAGPDNTQKETRPITKSDSPLHVKVLDDSVNVMEEAIYLIDGEEIRRSVGMDIDRIRSRNRWYIKETDKKLAQQIIDMFEEDVEVSPMIAFNDHVIDTKQPDLKMPKPDYEVEIIALAIKLLEEWSVLKEVFRIPKKERIEQMKEHEREANRGYKGGLEHDSDRRSRYRGAYRHKIDKIEVSERWRKGLKVDDRFLNRFPKINKHERRKLFAMQVEQAEVERRYKQRDMWRQHELQFMPMGADPRFTPPFDATGNFQCMWNQQTGQWLNFPVSRFSAGMHYSFNGGPNIPNMPPPMPNMALPAPPLPPHSLPNPLPTTNFTHPPPQTMLPHMQAAFPHQVPLHLSVPTPNLTLPPPSIPHPPQNMPLTSNVLNIPLPHAPPLPTGSMLPISVNNVLQPTPLENIRQMPNMLYQDEKISGEQEDVSQVKFAGPIPPPVKLPPKWKCAKDKYNRPYYYHIKLRIPQWEPPELPPPIEDEDSTETTSSSDTSSLSSDSSSEDSEDDEVDDTKLLLEIRRKFQQMESASKPVLTANTAMEPESMELVKVKVEDLDDNCDETQAEEDIHVKIETALDDTPQEFNLVKMEGVCKPKRQGLVTQVHIISPRTEEDKIFAKENLRKYKENKERLKRQKEAATEQTKKRVKVTVRNPRLLKKHKTAVKTKLKEAMDLNSEAAKRIKEAFRSSMAGVMVGILNPYRKPDCKEGKITNTEDFKHLARKLTHFVMLKELKHCQSLEELTCTESVKSKAKEFVRKYMSKFGENYMRPIDDLEY